MLNNRDSLLFISERRSVYPRLFDSPDVSISEIKELLEAGKWAPTHKLTQPWRFVVFHGEGKMRLARIQGEALQNVNNVADSVKTKQAKMIENAQLSGAIIAIVMKRDPEKRIPEFEEIAAVACAVQNVWLHASSLGLGGYWSTGGGTNSQKIRSELGLDAADLHLGWFYLGRFADKVQTERLRKSVDEFSTFRTV